MLAIARALMARPRLLLLDEPSLGLAPLIVQQIFDAIRELNRREKLTVFLVEQNAFHALKLAHRGYVMVNGVITLTRHRQGAAGAAGSASRLSRRRAALEEAAGMQRHPLRGRARSALFLLVTVVLGGGAAWLTGRAIARDLAALVACRALHADPGGARCASSISRCSRERCSRRTSMSSTRSSA